MGTYYVKYGGWAASWAACQNRATPGGLGQARVNAVAGDVVILTEDGGEYVGDGFMIWPANSGTEGNPITFKGEEGHTIVVAPRGEGFYLDAGQSYINIEDLTFSCKTYMDSRCGEISWGGAVESRSHHVTFNNCIFDTLGSRKFSALIIGGSAADIFFTNCDFIGTEHVSVRASDNMLYITSEYDSVIERVLIDNCNFLGGDCHAAVEIDANWSGTTRDIVVRNCYIENKNNLTFAYYSACESGLIENCVIAHAGSSCGQDQCLDNRYGSYSDRHNLGAWTKPNMEMGCDNTIVRNCLIYNGGMGFSADSGHVANNRVYHNVFAGNSIGFQINGPDSSGNVVKNNIFYLNQRHSHISDKGIPTGVPFQVGITGSPNLIEICYNCVFDPHIFEYVAYGGSTTASLTWWEANNPTVFHDNLQVDPKFVHAAGRDYRLQHDSPCIDAADWLTTANGAGTNSTTLVVDDAYVFSDGRGVIDPDTIQFEGQTSTYQIASIDYEENTITLETPATWTDGLGVSLPYSGTAPNIGAYQTQMTTKMLARVSGGRFVGQRVDA